MVDMTCMFIQSIECFAQKQKLITASHVASLYAHVPLLLPSNATSAEMSGCLVPHATTLASETAVRYKFGDRPRHTQSGQYLELS